MTDPKTRPNDGDVDDFIARVDAARRPDCKRLVAMMAGVTGEPARMWGSSIVGFGRYEQTYATGRTGSWFLTGFSPRKRNLTLYVMGGFEPHKADLRKLGKHKTGKACLYLNKLDDVDLAVLERIISNGVHRMRARSADAMTGERAGKRLAESYPADNKTRGGTDRERAS